MNTECTMEFLRIEMVQNSFCVPGEIHYLFLLDFFLTYIYGF